MYSTIKTEQSLMCITALLENFYAHENETNMNVNFNLNFLQFIDIEIGFFVNPYCCYFLFYYISLSISCTK